MDIFYRKKDKGIIIAGVAPVLYPKLRTSFRKALTDPIKIITGIFNKSNEKIDPQLLFNQKCKTMCDIVIEEIFKGVKPSIQVKIDTIIIIENCDVPRRLFFEDLDTQKFESNSELSSESDSKQSSENDNNDSEQSSENDSDDSDEIEI